MNANYGLGNTTWKTFWKNLDIPEAHAGSQYRLQIPCAMYITAMSKTHAKQIIEELFDLKGSDQGIELNNWMPDADPVVYLGWNDQTPDVEDEFE